MSVVNASRPSSREVPLASVLMAWTDIDEAEEPAFNEWYNHEHMRDRVIGVPGFIRGRRYVAVSGEPKYLALYEAVAPEVYASDAYLGLIGSPDPKSHHFILNFRRPVRTIARVSATVGESEGATLALLPLRRGPDWEAVSRRLVEDTMVSLVGRSGIVAAHLIERDDPTASSSTRRHVRQGDRSLDAALLIESADPAMSLDALTARIDPDLPKDPSFASSLFRLLYRVAPSGGGGLHRAAAER